MHTAICDDLDIEFPIFAFTHCRDVVVAVARQAVSGSARSVSPRSSLKSSSTGSTRTSATIPMGSTSSSRTNTRAWTRTCPLRADEDAAGHGAAGTRRLRPQDPVRPRCAHRGSGADAFQLLGWTEATATPQVEVALRHPKVTLIANALGTPPAEMIKHIHDEGRKVAALCGSPSQARKHADAGVDIIIAQGGEAGGHCGEVGSIVLWPQVVKEVAPVPVLAAGGIGVASRSPRRWRSVRRACGTVRSG